MVSIKTGVNTSMTLLLFTIHITSSHSTCKRKDKISKSQTVNRRFTRLFEYLLLGADHKTKHNLK